MSNEILKLEGVEVVCGHVMCGGVSVGSFLSGELVLTDAGRAALDAANPPQVIKEKIRPVRKGAEDA